jgi:hypothetical protein
VVDVTRALVGCAGSTVAALVVPLAKADQRVPAEFRAPTWNVYAVPARRPPTVTDVAFAPTDGPATQAPLPIRYCVTNPVSLFDASVHANTALDDVVDVTRALVGCAGAPTAGA